MSKKTRLNVDERIKCIRILTHQFALERQMLGKDSHDDLIERCTTFVGGSGGLMLNMPISEMRGIAEEAVAAAQEIFEKHND